MSKGNELWDSVKIARPCKVSWDGMSGDDKIRFCAKCKKNVYNISNMTQEQAEGLIRGKEGDLCVRLYRRIDGTVITRDCPLPVCHPWLITAGGVGFALVLSTFLTSMLMTQGQVEYPVRRKEPELKGLKAKIVYVIKDIGEGQVLGVDALEEKEVESSKLPQDAFNNISEVLDKRTRSQIRAGSIVYQHTVISK